MLTRGVLAGGKDTWLIAGCFLVATGPDLVHEQAFIADVFPQLLEMQDFVSWTRPALDEDARCNRWAKAGYAGLALFIAAILALGLLV